MSGFESSQGKEKSPFRAEVETLVTEYTANPDALIADFEKGLIDENTLDQLSEALDLQERTLSLDEEQLKREIDDLIARDKKRTGLSSIDETEAIETEFDPYQMGYEYNNLNPKRKGGEPDYNHVAELFSSAYLTPDHFSIEGFNNSVDRFYDGLYGTMGLEPPPGLTEGDEHFSPIFQQRNKEMLEKATPEQALTMSEDCAEWFGDLGNEAGIPFQMEHLRSEWENYLARYVSESGGFDKATLLDEMLSNLKRSGLSIEISILRKMLE